MLTTRRLAALVLALGLFGTGVQHATDPDMWWHLRTGQLILEQGIPRHDPFSFTVPGREWITHEWLSQVLMWVVYDVGDAPGLMIAFGILIACAFWLVYLACDGRPFLASLVVLLAAGASAIVFGARPQAFNLLLTAAFVLTVERSRAGRFPPRILWILPLLSILWANLHSGFLVGVVLLGTYAVGTAIDRRLHPGDQQTALEVRQTALVTVACVLAAGVNPNGPTLWWYPFSTLGSPAMQTLIEEWRSPDFHAVMFWPFAALAALGVLGWLSSRRRVRFEEVLLFMGTAAAGLLSSRHIPLFAIVSAPIVARHLLASVPSPRLQDILDGRTAQVHSPRASTINWAVFVLAAAAMTLWTQATIAGNEAAVQRFFPVQAVDFLERKGLRAARMYNTYNWGGYLIWRGVPVFVDGRADVYGDRFLFDAAKVATLHQDWAEPLDRFGVEYVLVEADAPLATLLKVSADWKELYRDGIARVFGRSGALPDP